MSIWFVPRDAAARSMGADAVASALEARGETVIRNGSRGMLWMEPLVERADDRHGPRVGWSNVSAGQIDAGLPDEQSDNFIGAVEEVDYLAKQSGTQAHILPAVHSTNERQKQKLAEQVIAQLGADLTGRTIAVWGCLSNPTRTTCAKRPAEY